MVLDNRFLGVDFGQRRKMATKLDKIFNSLDSDRVFKDKGILQTNYTPSTIPHRDSEIEQVASILAPALRKERPSNLFIYGKTGSGKTLSIHYVREEMLRRIKERNFSEDEFSLVIEYLNCKLKKVSDTEYRILAELIKKLGGEVPATGLPTDYVYQKFIEIIERRKQLVILILDEVDQAIKKISDNFLYNFTRLNSELSKAQICVVGISNDLTFLDSLDPRVRSSLSEEEVVFPPYNAIQLQDILKERAKKAFKEGVVEEGVIAKCAALAAREHGDARRCLDLMRVAGEIAERECSKKISIKHIDRANEKIERDKIIDSVQTGPKQFQLILLAIIGLFEAKHERIFTGEVYDAYQNLCRKVKTEILTQRRMGDILNELEMSGMIRTNVISKGRWGRMREIKISVLPNILSRAKIILTESLGL